MPFLDDLTWRKSQLNVRVLKDDVAARGLINGLQYSQAMIMVGSYVHVSLGVLGGWA